MFICLTFLIVMMLCSSILLFILNFVSALKNNVMAAVFIATLGFVCLYLGMRI